MVIEQATNVRKNWSKVMDSVIRERPALIRRTRDNIWMIDADMFSLMLSDFNFTATKFVEPDNTVTLSLNEMDLICNGANEADAKIEMANCILEYAEEYYDNFYLYSKDNIRQKHIPYVLRALTMTPEEIGEILVCQDGRN